MEKNKINLFWVFLFLPVLIWLMLKYASGMKFIAVFSLLIISSLILRPIYSLLPLVLFFWVPHSLNYLFLEEALVSAPAIEAISYVLLFLYILISAIKKKDFLDDLLHTPLLGPIFIFIAGSLISFLFGNPDDRTYAYIIFRQNSFYALAIYLLTANIIEDARDATKIMVLLLISNVFLASFVFYSYYFSNNMITVYSASRLSGEFSLHGKTLLNIGCIMLGDQMASVIPLVVAFILLQTKFFYRILNILALAIFSFILVSTGTRGAWFAAVVGAASVVYLLLRHKKGSVSSKAWIFTASILLLLIILYATQWSLQLNTYLADRLESLRYISKDISLLDRIDIWLSGLRAVFEYPLGMGFREVYPLGSFVVYPHSLYVGVLLTSGLLGFVGLFSFLIFWIRKTLIYLKRIDDNSRVFIIGALGSTLAFLTYSIFEDPLYSPDIIMPTMWIIWGTVAALWKREFIHKKS